jgi:hypothetical protein
MTEWHSGKKQQIFAVTHQHGESIFVGHRVEGGGWSAVAKEGAREGRERGNIKKGTRYIPLHPLYRAQTSPTYLGGVG